MSQEHHTETAGNTFAAELASNVINEDLAGSDVYRTLTEEQKDWLHKVAGPLIVTETQATVLEIEEARRADPRAGERELVKEVETYLQIGRPLDDMVEGE